MNRLLLGLLAFVVVQPVFGAAAKIEGEQWKGTPPTTDITVGFLGGMAIRGSSVGGVLTGNIAKKIIDHGFATDMNNQVFIEMQAGPEFISGRTLLGISTHLRWDFHKNVDFSLYGLGGLAGLFGTGVTEFAPRFGAGAFWHLEYFAIRGEISHNWIMVGASLPL